MPKATENLIKFPQESRASALDVLLREGAVRMLGTAIEAEVAAYAIAWLFATVTCRSERSRPRWVRSP